MILQFEQFKTEITNPVVEVVKVNDKIQQKICDVEVLLSVEGATFGVTLNGFTYDITWEDIDIENWVNTKLTEYEV